MRRTSSTPAVVLRRRRVGEIHQSLTLLTPGLGLVQAMAHGALKPKSRLRAVSEPFHLLLAYLYHEPVKGQYKITDAESIRSFEEIRRSVAKYYTASLWAEASLKSYGGGQDSGALFRLLVEALELLDRARPGKELALSIQFLLRFLSLSGHRVELESCSRCRLAFETSSAIYLSREDGAFVCAGCASAGDPELPAGARRYLEKTLSLTLAHAGAVGLSEGALHALRGAVYTLVQASLEAPLNSLHCGVGIL